MGVGLLHNAFGDDMISVTSKSGFFAREFLKMALRTLGAALLQALTQTMMTLTNFLHLLTTEGFAFAIGGKVDDTQVNPKRPTFRHVGCRFRDIKGHSQVEGSLAVNQIGLPFDTIQTGLLIASYLEGNQHASRERQERDGEQTLKGHDPLIVNDSSLWLEGRLDALVSFVDLSDLADSTNSQLSGKFVGGTQFAIDHLLQRNLVC